jgi:hypothetical protein
MENPFSKNSRTARKGHKNFLNCALKNTVINARAQGNNRNYSYIQAILVECPTLDGGGEISVENTNTTHKDAAAVKNALSGLAKTCGAAMCSSCVYVGMETPVEVSRYRIARDQAELEAIDIHKALLLAHQDVAAIEAQNGLAQTVELHIIPTAQEEIS